MVYIVLFQKCWDILEKGVLVFFQEVYAYCSFEKSLNASFVNLILKLGARSVRKLWPISLAGILYKILANILDKRLKMIIGKLVTKFHYAFIQGS